VLTTNIGLEMYGACVTFYEPLAVPLLSARQSVVSVQQLSPSLSLLLMLRAN
jgi:hypothetical protein